MNRPYTFAIATIACLLALPAHAYLGPASNSMGAELVIGGAVAAVLIIVYSVSKYFYRRIRGKARPLGKESEE